MTSPVKDVTVTMKQNNIDAVLLTHTDSDQGDGSIVGIITAHDIAQRVVAVEFP